MSEFSLIYQHFQNATQRHTYTDIGIGDDCAVSAVPADMQLVSCVDVLVAGRHFPIDTRGYAIGHKAVAVNLSDLAAMGATPYAILLGLSLPQSLANEAWLADFTRGMAEICRQFNVELIGGDTTRSEVLTLSVTALGFVPHGQAITRGGAQVGDIICVSGDIGSASFALSEILAGTKSALQHALDLPIPQVTLGQQLRGFASGMIDISDGLGQDLGHILSASQVGALIDLAKIPAHALLQALPKQVRWQHQMNGGDDYQLCFTLPKKAFATLQAMLPHPIYAIGKIVAKPGLSLLDGGRPIDFPIQGYQHF